MGTSVMTSTSLSDAISANPNVTPAEFWSEAESGWHELGELYLSEGDYGNTIFYSELEGAAHWLAEQFHYGH